MPTVFFEIHTVVKAGDPPSQNGVPSVERLPNGDLFCVWSNNPFIMGRKPEEAEIPFDLIRHPGRILGSFSRDNGCAWEKPVVLADKADGDPSLAIAGRKIILHYGIIPYFIKGGEIYYRYSRFMQRVSVDFGKTWNRPEEINTGHKYHPAHGNGLKLRNGLLVRPYYYVKNMDDMDSGGDILERDMVCVSSVLSSTDGGKNWVQGGDVHPIAGMAGTVGIDEPAIVELSNGDLFMLARTGTGRLYQATSKDNGKTWSKPEPSVLVSPSAPGALYRLSFKPNRVIVAWNNSTSNRYPLDVAISYDDCKTWAYARTLTNPGRQVAYPSITMASDGSIIIVFHEAGSAADKRIKWPYWRNILAARVSEKWIKG